MLEGLKKMHRRHEAERRDHHNNDREARRQMDARHAKELKDHFETNMGQMGGDPAAAAGGAPAAGGEPAPAAPAGDGAGE
jgi:hypothetical protein